MDEFNDEDEYDSHLNDDGINDDDGMNDHDGMNEHNELTTEFLSQINEDSAMDRELSEFELEIGRMFNDNDELYIGKTFNNIYGLRRAIKLYSV